MLSFEDKILIKNLRECKNYSSRRLIKEFPNKNWKRKTLDDFLRKLRTTGSVERAAGSGRPKSSRTEDNIAAVNELVQSQEDKPKTHLSTRQIARELNLTQTTVRRIIHNDLELKCLWNSACTKSAFRTLMNFGSVSYPSGTIWNNILLTLQLISGDVAWQNVYVKKEVILNTNFKQIKALKNCLHLSSKNAALIDSHLFF